MPYIKQENRAALDGAIQSLVNAIYFISPSDEKLMRANEGDVNYAITRLLDTLYNTNYRDINTVVGILECVKLEYYRRLAVPYEIQKCSENGDVY